MSSAFLPATSAGWRRRRLLAGLAGVAGAALAGPGRADAVVPRYAAQLPPAAELEYALRQGLLSGTGVLRWQPAADLYAISLEARVLGLTALVWSSTGRIDAGGLAPLRFGDRRLSRSERVAEFDRGAATIRYSGMARQTPLVAGAQDRLSWMVQLPAIVAADASLRDAGREVSMFVTGARGDADLWRFVVQGRQDITLPAGAVAGALHLRRVEAASGHTRAEAWLDPARAYLPVRARIVDGDDTDFSLRR